MALNVKVAMMVCMACIGAISWVAQKVAAPQMVVPSPLVEDARPVNFARASGMGQMDWRADRARSLEYANAFERQLQENHSDVVTLPVSGPTPGPGSEVILAELPPLVAQGSNELEPALVDRGDEPIIALAAYGEPPVEVPLPESTSVPKRYRVSRGDTLTRIIRREWQSDDRRLVEFLTTANPKLAQRKDRRILVGEELVIPTIEEARRWLAQSASVEMERPAPEATGGWYWYRIQRKDTLAGIAQRFLKDGRRWREIVELNGQLNPRKIVPGTRIKLPVALRVART